MPITHRTNSGPSNRRRRSRSSRTCRRVGRRRPLLLLLLWLRSLGLVVVGFLTAEKAAEAFFDLGEGVGSCEGG